MNTTPPIYPLGYEKPLPPRQVFSWSIFLTTAVLMFLYGVFFYIVVPHMEQVYRSFQVRLPWPTQMILQLGRLSFPWGAIVLACVPFILAVLVPLMLPSSTRDGAIRSNRWAARAVRLLLLGLLLAMMLALMTPLYSLINTLTSPGSKKS